MLKHIMCPKTGWFILHGAAMILIFLLGYSIKF
jgi:hypothetical protein